MSGRILRPRAVLFDLDGVLVDSYRVWFAVMNAAAAHFGVPPISPAAFQETWGQGVDADRDRFYPKQSVRELEAFFDAHYEDHLEHLEVAGAVPRVFAHLAEQGIPSAVVTNCQNPLARKVVARAGATPAVVVGGNDVPRAKPAPDMMWRACALVGVAPAESLVVGDSRFDREAALAAGCRFAGLGIDGGEVALVRLDDLLALVGPPAGAR